MIPAAIDLDLLRTYAAVCRQGSLSRAARVSGRAQPTLSMQMRRLEGLLGRALLRRTGRGMAPTPEDELFLGYALRILALGDEAAARLNGPALEGTVRIALPEEIALAALSAALGQFRRVHPGVALDVLVDNTATVEPLWRGDKLDVMVGLPSLIPGLAMATWDVGLRWVCGLDYEPDGEGPLDLVVFAEPCTWRDRMLDALVASGRAWRIAFTSRSIAAVQAAVENGLGLTLLTPECISPAGMRPLPRRLGLPEPMMVQYGLYARKGQSPAVQAVAHALLQGVLVHASDARSAHAA